MAIVHIGNFYGIDETIITDMFVSLVRPWWCFNDFYEINLPNNTGIFHAGRDPSDLSKSRLTLSNVVNSANGVCAFNIAKSLAKLTQGSDDCVVLGFKYKYSGELAVESVNGLQAFTVGHYAGTGADITLYKDVSYNVEVKMSRNGTNKETDRKTLIYINKVLCGTYNTIIVGNIDISIYQVIANATVYLSDIFISIDKEDDAVKSGLPGPLDVRHHTPTIASDIEDWKVIDATAQSIHKPDVTILEALSDNDIGKPNAEKTVALTDKTGSQGKFKFGSIPAGNYAGYSIDTFVNKPPSQAGDLLTEVYEGNSETASVSKITKNIIQTPGVFQLVNVVTSDTPITDVELKNLTLGIGSKKMEV